MFGSNPFGQSSSSSFGPQPVFGQTSNASSNPFAPKPFGSTSPFGPQAGGSIFGGMSTGVFGAQSSSPLGSTSVFGASPSPAFGSSTQTFGASTGSAFGNSSSAFGEAYFWWFLTWDYSDKSFWKLISIITTSVWEQSIWLVNPFSTPSQPAFGSSSSHAFGASGASAFGCTSTPGFGSTASPTFGSTSGGFGVSSSPFGSSNPAFGASSTPAFGFSSTPVFGASSTPTFGATILAFGATSTPAFGATSIPAFSASATPAFGASSTPRFNFGSSPAFAQSTPAFGSSPFGTTSSFGVQSSSFGAQPMTPTFGSSSFGHSVFRGQRVGSRVSPYSATPEIDTGAQPAGKLESISTMPDYKDKSHEELRWEDYQLGDKGTCPFNFGSNPAFGQSTPAFGNSPFATTSSFGVQSSSFGAQPMTPTFGSSGFGHSVFREQRVGSRVSPYSATPEIDTGTQLAGKLESISTMPDYKNKSHEELRWEDYQLGDKGTCPLNFGSNPAFGQSTPAFGNSPFATTSSFGVPSSSFGAQATTPTFGSSGFGHSVFGGQRGGSRVSPYSGTPKTDTGSQPAEKLESISAMPVYEDKSHEELGWENYQLGDKGTRPFNFGSSPAFGQSTLAFGSSPFATTSSFGVQSSSFGAQATTPTFGSSGFGHSVFGGQRGGSRVYSYLATPETDTGSQPTGKLESISAMPVYKDKSHEELKWENYQLGDKGTSAFNFGLSPAFGQSTPAFGSSPFGTTSSFGVQNSSFGALATTPTFGSFGFGHSVFGGHRGGSRVSPYSATPETDIGTQPAGKLESISAMPVYNDKSHEELRWEDNQLEMVLGLSDSGFKRAGLSRAEIVIWGARALTCPFNNGYGPRRFRAKRFRAKRALNWLNET